MYKKIYSKLIEWKKSKSRPPLLLEGERQVGKVEFLNLYPLGFEKFLRII